MPNFDEEAVLSITIDTDWAPTECLCDMLTLLEVFQVPATIFATLGTFPDILEGYDLGIHPNFEIDGDIAAMQREIARCLEAFPNARGLRSHALFGSSRLYMLIKEDFPQIEYISNYYIPADRMRPFIGRGGLPELPIFWMDSAHLFLSESIESEAILKDAERPGLKIFDFHPYHVFINTQNEAHAAEAMKVYHEPRELVEYRRTGDGVAMLFCQLLERAKEENWKILTCHEIAKSLGEAK